MDPKLRSRLEAFAARQQKLRLWWALAGCWAAAALVGWLVLYLQRNARNNPNADLLAIVVLAVIAAALSFWRVKTRKLDWRQLAAMIEARFPELDGRLLTAVQQVPGKDGTYNLLQERLLEQTLQHAAKRDWNEAIPHNRLRTAQIVHLLALLAFVATLFQVRPGAHPQFFAQRTTGVTITPGDTTIERGSSLVIMARFDGILPAAVDLVVPQPADPKHSALVKSLADPIFGGSIAEVSSNFAYHIEYAGQRTRDFQVTVFEYPKLERADADVTFPAYTGLKPQHISDTRRVSAVEGSKLALNFKFNKPVTSARFVSKDKKDVIPLMLPQNKSASAVLQELDLSVSHSYDLQLVDAEGRTNKVPAQFVFAALTNRSPELKLATPRGDQRPSPLEEIAFEGTVWDDFGVKAYGLGYTVAGEETRFIELGTNVAGGHKEPFKYMLKLEDISAQPDQFISWFVWADDLGPDGQLRRSAGDLFFAEVRPFEEVFREGQGGEQQQGGQQQGQGQGGGQATKLAELQKQIISATWKLQNMHGGAAKQKTEGKNNVVPRPRSSDSSKGQTQIINSQPESLSKLFATSGSRFFGQMAQTSGQSQAPRQRAGQNSGRSRLSNLGVEAGPSKAPTLAEDATVVHDAQAQALQQAEESAGGRQLDPRSTALWEAAAKQMELALARLKAATNSPASLPEALAAEQAAYQTLLKLQEHQYQVVRSRNRSQQGGGQSQQMQRQLQEMELTQTPDRYETQRQAQRPPAPQRNEQLQVQNRLQELARRQQDLNDRLKELQTALQEAKTDQEREEIQRRLKRLQEEEQQMLSDVDEVRQRMDRPENQEQMAEQRKQLDQTREDIQKASEAAAQGAASQALASGTRAQRQLQDMRDQMRRENSSQFADDLRDMRAQARELARQQDEIQKKIENDSAEEHKSLADSSDRKGLLDQLARQTERMTNLVERATQISEQAEVPEPLLSRQLYDTVRKFNQDTSREAKAAQEELVARGTMTRTLYDQLKDGTQTDAAKLNEMTLEMLKLGFQKQASQTSQRARSGIEDLKSGVERAAESVLGDDTESLKLAQQHLDQLMEQLQQEMTQAESAAAGTNQGLAQAGTRTNALGQAQNGTGQRSQRGQQPGESGQQQELAQAGQEQQGQTPGQQGQQGQQSQQGQQGQRGQQGQGQRGQNPGQGNQPGQQGDQSQTADNSQSQSGANGQGGGGNQNGGQPRLSDNQQNADPSSTPQELAARGNRNGSRRANAGANRLGGANAGGGEGGDGGDVGGYLDRFWDRDPNYQAGPILGEDFVPWSDRLRDVEEMIELPDLRNEVAAARERARVLRQDVKKERKKPDWAVVRLQVMKPLAEVRERIADELAKRESREALVPIDRDPVPNRYSDLVRRYYEELGKSK